MRRLGAPRSGGAPAAPDASSGGLLRAVERLAGLTSNGLIVLGIVIAGFVLGRVIASRPLLVMVYGLLLAVGVAWLLGRRNPALRADRSSLPTRVREGQLVPVELSLTASRRISTIVIEEVLDGTLGRPVRIPVPVLPSGETVNHTYSFVPRLRGVFEVGPLVAEWSDPFGVTRRRLVLTEPVKIIVHPRVELVHDRVISRAWEDPPIRPPVSKPWPTGFEFYGMRDYVNGDDPRRIVWRATARTLDSDGGGGRYLVRESEQGITDRVNLFLDNDKEFHSPGAPSESFETAVRAVASLGQKHLHDGFAVTVDVNGERIAQAYRGKRAEIQLLDRLAEVQLDKVPLEDALTRLMYDPNRRAHNVLVTPYLSRETASRLRLLMNRGASLLIAFVSGDETDPAALHRAGTLGCNVVEIRTGSSLERVFQHAVGARR